MTIQHGGEHQGGEHRGAQPREEEAREPNAADATEANLAERVVENELAALAHLLTAEQLRALEPLIWLRQSLRGPDRMLDAVGGISRPPFVPPKPRKKPDLTR